MRWDDPVLVAATITVSATVTLTMMGIIISALVGRPKTISDLRADIVKAWAEIEAMKTRIDSLEESNASLRSFRTNVLAYINGPLLSWIEGGAKPPAPLPPVTIATDIVWGPHWWHPTAETPTPSKTDPPKE